MIGKLSIKWVAYPGTADKATRNFYAYITDGSGNEYAYHRGDNNGVKEDSYGTILKAGEIYYLYFTDNNVQYDSKFAGFAYDTTVPSTIDATIGSTGFATFSSTYPLDLSSTTLKAYTASLTGESDKTALFTPIKTGVPASTGLFIKGEQGTEAIPVKAGFTTAPATNLLKASADEEIAASADGTYHYVLADGTNGVGFYNLASAKNIGAGKAYLETTQALSSENHARVAWTFDDEELTGINDVEIAKIANSQTYNLNGQRVAAPKKGLYIINGKKIIIK